MSPPLPVDVQTPLFTVTLPVKPQTKQRPRTVRRNGITRTYTPKETAGWEKRVAVLLRSAMVSQHLARINKPRLVRLHITFVFPRPKGWPKTKRLNRQPHGVRPDLDNITKALKDAMDGVVVQDDAQIVQLHAEKWYAAAGQPACISLSLWEVMP